MKNRLLVTAGLLCAMSSLSHAQSSKAWEIGLGATGAKVGRISLLGVENTFKGSSLDLSKREVIFGGNISIARELTPHLFVDMQGTALYDRMKPSLSSHINQVQLMAGLGLQWRLGHYFDNKYIDPFLRIGANYQWREFSTSYSSSTSLADKEAIWAFTEALNKGAISRDRTHSFPISLGAGVNLWLNDHFGLGMQADYLLQPYRQVANSVQGTIRLSWRIGGKTLKRAPEVAHRDIIQQIEVPVVIPEPLPETLALRPNTVCELLSSVYFDFDKADIKPDASLTLDKLALQMIENQGKHYLITGCTDGRGSKAYNLDLSTRRAKAVVNALVERGVAPSMLKYRGVGEVIHIAPVRESHQVRKMDRKILVEEIPNQGYWDLIP